MSGKLPANFGADVIPIHVVTPGSRTKFYNDKLDAEGKIYIDLESGSKDHYVYDETNREFLLLSPEIATEADINAMF